METELLTPDEAGLQKAAGLIREGQVVGMPTETVYGLAADATNRDAVAKVFAAKGRPMDNPLIVHISSMEELEQAGIEEGDTVRMYGLHFTYYK